LNFVQQSYPNLDVIGRKLSLLVTRGGVDQSLLLKVYDLLLDGSEQLLSDQTHIESRSSEHIELIENDPRAFGIQAQVRLHAQRHLQRNRWISRH
jgi:hypothetical protein